MGGADKLLSNPDGKIYGIVNAPAVASEEVEINFLLFMICLI